MPTDHRLLSCCTSVDVAKPGAYLSISEASTEVFRGSMRLVVGKQGKVEVATGNFKPATANNLSLIEFELVTADLTANLDQTTS